MTPPRPDSVQALTRAPPCPKHLSPQEKLAWNRIWSVLIPLKKASAADVLIVEQAARAASRINELWTDADLKASTLVSAVRLYKELLRDLSLTPASRDSVSSLSRSDDADEDPLA